MNAPGTMRVGLAREGEGVPVVFLHAFPLDANMWSPLAEDLVAAGVERPLLALDYPGFGGTPGPLAGTPSLDALADSAVATLLAEGYPRAVWVGCSMGGYTALAIAERHPDSVAGLALVDTKATADSDEARTRRLAIASQMDLLMELPDPLGMAEPLVGLRDERRDGVLARVVEIIATQRPEAVAWGQRAMAARPDRTGVLAALSAPVAVIWGHLDEVATHADAEAMADAAGVPATVIPEAGHLSPVEDPAAVAVALLPLLEAAR